MRKISFSKQNLLFLKINYRMSVKYGTTLRGECVGELPQIVMVLIRNDLLDRLPTPFSGKSSCEIPFATMFIFQKIHVMHSHLISRLPGAYEMHYAISTILYQYIKYAYILNFTITPHVIQRFQPSPKLAHLSKSQSHLQMSTHTIIFHIIVTSS